MPTNDRCARCGEPADAPEHCVCVLDPCAIRHHAFEPPRERAGEPDTAGERQPTGFAVFTEQESAEPVPSGEQAQKFAASREGRCEWEHHDKHPPQMIDDDGVWNEPWPCPVALLVAEVRRLTGEVEAFRQGHIALSQAVIRERKRAEKAERELGEARQGEKDACAITGRLARELGEEHAARMAAEREAAAARTFATVVTQAIYRYDCEIGYDSDEFIEDLNRALAAFRGASKNKEG